MSNLPSPALLRAAKWLALLFCSAVIVADIRMGSPYDPSWWAGAFFFIALQVGPMLLALACVLASRTALGQALFLILALLFAGYTGFVYYEVMQSTSSTAPVAFVIVPILQIGVWGLVTIVAAVAGWRAKDSWLRDGPAVGK